MSYFDHAADEDLKLLHASVRQHDELGAVASQAEADVVHKAGYAPAASSDAASGAEAEALRRTIADVTEHRLKYYDEDHTLSLQSRGSRSKARSAGALDPKWPKNWRWRLRTFSNTVYGC